VGWNVEDGKSKVLSYGETGFVRAIYYGNQDFRMAKEYIEEYVAKLNAKQATLEQIIAEIVKNTGALAYCRGRSDCNQYFLDVFWRQSKSVQCCVAFGLAISLGSVGFTAFKAVSAFNQWRKREMIQANCYSINQTL
jgi:hypothetical protein